MTQQEALFKYTLRLGDNALILSQRLSEWCSNAPFIEEDLALTNFALDMIGRAQVLLRYAGEVEGKEKSEDILAFRRSERQYYNNQIAEQPNGDFACTMVRQLFISAFELYLFTELQKSKDATIAAVAAKTLKEVRYHLAHAEDWIIRLGNGTTESHNRVQQAVNDLWMFTGEQFEMDETDNLLIAEGIAADLHALQPLWSNYIENILSKATIKTPQDAYMQTGSRKGIHTEHLGHLLSDMQYLQRAYPDAIW
ncbi:phenylacetate-CoA oxygenase subunit PaaI [Chitinophagaceae bacterium IBVUCB1]|nr:phenylacetate-CoA oxygenase subunit PaaI [Chitinophagaceae bacterium IBVUCB1]